MRYAARADKNQKEIMSAIRQLGADCVTLHRLGQGAPDLLVPFAGVWTVAELKTDNGIFTPKQVKWHERFGYYAPIEIWHSWQEAIDYLMTLKVMRA